MKKYTVKDTATGKKVTFSWDGANPPTDKDMSEVFAQAQKSQVGNVGSKDWLPESRGGIPKWGLKHPSLWGARGAGLEVLDKVVQPIVEAVGMTAGSMASPVAGTALGYGIGKKSGEIVSGFAERVGIPKELQRPQKSVARELGESTRDVGTSLAMGYSFKLAAKAIRPIDEKITDAIKYGMEKGVSPTVVGKRTYTQSQNYNKKASDAVKTIVENKNNLSLTDEYGDIAKGLPKNLRQFSQAIEQTKKGIYEKYDALAKLAGDRGAEVSAEPIVKELRAFINNKSIKTLSPTSATYAQKLIDRFSIKNSGITSGTIGNTTRDISALKFTSEEAQDMIKVLNQSLDAFYKNPTAQFAKRAYVDQMIANRLRQGLDDAILNTTGKHYQVLKNKYGSLKSIEREVNHRAIADARKNPKGLLDFSDVFTGFHAAKGILSMEPSTIAAAGAGKTVAWLYRIKNQPNRIVKNMFSTVDRLMEKQGALGGIESIPKTPPAKSTTTPTRSTQRKPTGQKMSFEEKGITHTGQRKQRIPIGNKSQKSYKVVKESGTGALKIVEVDQQKY